MARSRRRSCSGCRTTSISRRFNPRAELRLAARRGLSSRLLGTIGSHEVERDMNPLVQALTNSGSPLLQELEAIYKDLHAHPELSMEEVRTAKIAADHITKLGYEVTREVGVTGVVGVLRNGAGPTVMLRADMDALPMAENTGLPYASTVKAKDDEGHLVPVAHSCGHDLHVTWLMGAARILAEHRGA